jgi:hypothetical protein
MDLRFANLLRFYYDVKRGKHGRAVAIGEFTLYPDIVERAAEAQSTSDLRNVLGRFAEPSNG